MSSATISKAARSKSWWTTIDRFNASDEDGNCRVRVHAIGFPVVLGQAQSAANYAALMRELTARNCGTFVGLASYE